MVIAGQLLSKLKKLGQHAPNDTQTPLPKTYFLLCESYSLDYKQRRVKKHLPLTTFEQIL